jgi:hypothetical protein
MVFTDLDPCNSLVPSLLSHYAARLFLTILKIRHYYQKLSRTVPSFRTVLAEEKQEWKSFRDALDRKEKKAVLHDYFDTSTNPFKAFLISESEKQASA